MKTMYLRYLNKKVRQQLVVWYYDFTDIIYHSATIMYHKRLESSNTFNMYL